MSGKHTPGPWVVGDAPDSRVAVYAGACCVAVVGEQGYPVIDADATLISAAPDLLAALEAVLFSAEALLDDLESHDGWRADPESFGAARAAIAKAKGSTP